MLFPALMLAFMAACCAFVLPVTFHSVDVARKTITINECYMLYNYLPPYDDARGNTSSTSLISNVSKGCYVSNADGQLELVETPSLANFRVALVQMEDAIVGNITGNDTKAADYWNYSLPELQFLGSVGVLKPQGKINPIDGLMNMVLTWKPSISYPRNVPLSNGSVLNPDTDR